MAKGRLRIAIEDFIETFGFGDKIGKWIRGGVEGVELETAELSKELLDMIKLAAQESPEAAAVISRILSGKKQGGVAGMIGFGAQVGMGAASSILAPVFRIINYSMDRVIRSARVDPQVAWTITRRNPDQAEQMQAHMKQLGWQPRTIDAWDEITRPLVPENTLLELLLREEISQADFSSELIKRGWDAKKIAELQKAREIIPGTQDLILMAVREAFNPEAIQRFGLASEFPTEFGEWTEKQGLSREWAEKFWIAHWVLPGLQTGYQMLHRLRPGESSNPFTLDDMRALLKAQDISPAFREQLIEISFRPYTRVDVRRMFDQGILNEAEVLASYKDIGYNDARAENLTAWTIRQAQSGNRELTRTIIIKAFKVKQLSEPETLQALQDIGYTAENSSFFIAVAIAEQQEDEQADIISGIKFLYVEGQIDKNGAVSLLASEALPGAQITQLFVKWDIQRTKKIRLPTRGELDNFYIDDIIGDAEYLEGLKAKRYKPESVIWFQRNLDIRKADIARKEAERIAKEAERILASVITSDYFITKTALDVDIAELRLVIAELKLLLHDIEDTDVIKEIKRRITEINVLITNNKLTLALLRHDLETT